MKNKLKNKKGMELETLGWWFLGILALIITVVAITILKGKGVSAIDYIRNIFRFR